ncbi:toxin-antitoxin system YwqK family antitoxin [Costertonia aggregata]|uniref:Nicotinic acid mononucleotide adenyltransferase n=1 Tax=Costertonia aggregata TaxID=343403 RepID=A0A7H9ANV6_9FLAO|nr:nicotinic acid mononucleotide adenyltransferase [Costertonia aggregata]QLG45118.1 nicotinic acid mononucleotide adenyltransferase [Costertonia aggregata]
MKKILMMAAFFCTVTLVAQNIEPKFEKNGDMVEATYFHDNGNIAQTGYFLNGTLNGKWKMYDAQGKKIAMGEYVNGVKTGKWFFWKGQQLTEVDYDNNAIASVVKWNNGEAVAVNK